MCLFSDVYISHMIQSCLSLVHRKVDNSVARNFLSSFLTAQHSPVATPICSTVNLVAARSVLFFIWNYGYIGFLSLVARAATLGNSCNLHKRKMAAMDSRFASAWDISQLIYLKSCVTPLYQMLLQYMRVNNFPTNCHKKTIFVSNLFSYLRNPMPYVKLISN